LWACKLTQNCPFLPKFHLFLTNACSKTNTKQQWIIPISGSGYYVNKYDTNICLNIKKNGVVLTDLCSKSETKIEDKKFSYGKEAIWTSYNDSLCLGILESSKPLLNNKKNRNNNSIKVKMNTCNTNLSDRNWSFIIINSKNTTSKNTTTRVRSTITKITSTKPKSNKTTSLVKPTFKSQCRNGYGSCDEGYCCSKYGWCGKTSDYCSDGCQLEFGICNEINSTGNEKDIDDITDRCGEEYGKCADGLCCSKFGWCGTTSDHCGIGCQSQFGNCDNNIKIFKSLKSTASIIAHTLCISIQ
jgi:hypothetical protein